MSKINAVRFINLSYNHNQIQASDEPIYFNGDSTLLQLQNGGGKSVIVQMISSLFVQKRYRNVKDRPFSSYFNSHQPSFILVEWKLDQGAGYVLTGMMVRQNQKPADGMEDELEIINFITEYSGLCGYDLRSLPVMEKTDREIRIKSFMQCRQLFESYKKDREIKFNYYDMSQSAQSKQYFSKLSEYGINYREWQDIIRKVNEEESGLSKLFSDCKDEAGLVKKWFLDAIQKKLNKEQNRETEFQNIIEKYITTYRDNEAKIRRRDSIELFTQEAENIREAAEVLKQSNDARNQHLRKIVSYVGILNSLKEAAEDEKLTEENRLSSFRAQIMETEYQKESSFYHAWKQKYLSYQETIEALNRKIDETDTLIHSLNNSIHVQSMAQKQESLDEARGRYEHYSQQLDVLRSDLETMKPERDYIGFLLKKIYEEELRKACDYLSAVTAEKEAEEKAENNLKDTLNSVQSELLKETGKKGKLDESVQRFDETEQQYCRSWNTSFERNVLGEYETGMLEEHKAALQKKEAYLSKEIMRLKENSEQLYLETRETEAQIEKIHNEHNGLIRSLADCEHNIIVFDDELNVRKCILPFLQLKDDDLFHRDRILHAIENKISEFDAVIQNNLLEQKRLEKQVLQLSSGHTVELSDEVRKQLEDNGIRIVYGFEWLKKNGNNEFENRKLIERNPFLPYSLIMSQEDIARLEHTEGTVFADSPIPIVIRETITEKQYSENNGLVAFEDLLFYVMFNHSLLNEETLAKVIEDIKAEAAALNEKTEQNEINRNDYIGRKETILHQTVTEELYNAETETLSRLRVQKEEKETELADLKQHLSEVQKKKESCENLMHETQNQKNSLILQEESFALFSEAYDTYLCDLKALAACEAAITSLQKKIDELQEELSKKSQSIRQKAAQIKEAEYKRNEKETEASPYSSFTETAMPAGFNEADASDKEKLRARYEAITEGVSRQENELMKEQADAKQLVEKAQRDLNDSAKNYQLQEEDWRETVYSASITHDLERRISDSQKEKDRLQKCCAEEQANSAVAGSKMEESLSRIRDSYEMDEPLPMEEIPSLDFQSRIKDLKKQAEKCGYQLDDIRQRINMLDTSRMSLSEFGNYEMEPAELPEPFETYTKQQFETYTASLKSEYEMKREAVDSAKTGLSRTIQEMINHKDFKEDYYAKPLKTILSVSDNAEAVLQQLSVVLTSYSELMEKILIDIGLIEEEKDNVIQLLCEYIKEVNSHMGKIDKNSSVVINDRSLKMLKITCPDWNDREAVYAKRTEDYLYETTEKGIEYLNKGESLHDYVGKMIVTERMFDAVIGIHEVHVQLYKIESSREVQISWNEVASNSGGEGFLSAFVILSSLLDYMRYDESDVFQDRKEGKVLLMDNPFAQTTSAHLLKPMMELANKSNTQLICLTAITIESINERFDNIYTLNLVPSSLGKKHYLKSHHDQGREPDILTMSRFEVKEKPEQFTLF